MRSLQTNASTRESVQSLPDLSFILTKNKNNLADSSSTDYIKG